MLHTSPYIQFLQNYLETKKSMLSLATTDSQVSQCKARIAQIELVLKIALTRELH